MAVTGNQCVASCALTPGTIAYDIMTAPNETPATIHLHHPMGVMDVVIDYDMTEDGFTHRSAGLIRTRTQISKGELFIPPLFGKDKSMPCPSGKGRLTISAWLPLQAWRER